MFTGIIEEVGKISNLHKNSESMTLEIFAPAICEGTKIGESIAVNGVCTTVTAIKNSAFTVDISTQTLKVTTLKDLKTNELVNLERAMTLSDRLGGHIVTGHVDFCGTYVSKREGDNSGFLTFEIPDEKTKYFVEKGSVTINGISLTVAEKKDNLLTVCIIPHTLKNTNLNILKLKDNVNIEIDILAKYIENFVQSNDNKSKISEAFLKENGF